MFVLTPFLLFTEEDPDFVPDDAELGYRYTPNLACGTGPVQDVFADAVL